MTRTHTERHNSHLRAGLASRSTARDARGEVNDAQTMLAALTAAIGLAVVVTKQRHLFLWQNVRIHLDDVEQLGSFIELEAVAEPDSDLSHEHTLIGQLRTTFAITDNRLIATGYAHQLNRGG